MSSIAVVVGAQFGSEAKGHATKQIITRHLRDHGADARVVNIRVAGPNAGHCALDKHGVKWALRTVPMAVVIEDDRIRLHIAAGSEIDPDVLFDELDRLDEAGLNASGRLSIDSEATILTHEHIDSEAGMQQRMGSTGKGIGAARAARIMRTAKRLLDDSVLLGQLRLRGVSITNFNDDDLYYGNQQLVIIEGTQGYGLGLHAGFYPQCTSSDTRAIDFLAMAGINPWNENVNVLNVYAVARVFPIRVAGNSGPLLGETSWEELGLPEELTTVTKKVRRVGLWDDRLINAAVRANGGSPVVSVVLTMLDQQFPLVEGANWSDDPDDLAKYVFTPAVTEFIEKVERDARATVALITTGEDTGLWLD